MRMTASSAAACRRIHSVSKLYKHHSLCDCDSGVDRPSPRSISTSHHCGVMSRPPFQFSLIGKSSALLLLASLHSHTYISNQVQQRKEISKSLYLPPNRCFQLRASASPQSNKHAPLHRRHDTKHKLGAHNRRRGGLAGHHQRIKECLRKLGCTHT